MTFPQTNPKHTLFMGGLGTIAQNVVRTENGSVPTQTLLIELLTVMISLMIIRVIREIQDFTNAYNLEPKMVTDVVLGHQ
jgi:hypothetical protein